MRIKEIAAPTFDNALSSRLEREAIAVRPTVVDVRGLEPPEPLERVLTELALLPAGGELLVLIHREPLPLYRILARNGYQHETTLAADGTYQIRVWQRRA